MTTKPRERLTLCWRERDSNPWSPGAKEWAPCPLVSHHGWISRDAGTGSAVGERPDRGRIAPKREQLFRPNRGDRLRSNAHGSVWEGAGRAHSPTARPTDHFSRAPSDHWGEYPGSFNDSGA